jgi:hypothetical protein
MPECSARASDGAGAHAMRVQELTPTFMTAGFPVADPGYPDSMNAIKSASSCSLNCWGGSSFGPYAGMLLL